MSFLKQHLKNSCPNCLQEYNGSSHVCASSAVVKSPAAVPAPEALFNMPMLRTWVLAFDHAEAIFDHTPATLQAMDKLSAKVNNHSKVTSLTNFVDATAKVKEYLKDYDQMYARWAHLCILEEKWGHWSEFLTYFKVETEDQKKDKIKAAIDNSWHYALMGENSVDLKEKSSAVFQNFNQYERKKFKKYYPEHPANMEEKFKKACEYLRILTSPFGFNKHKDSLKKKWLDLSSARGNKLEVKDDKKERVIRIINYLMQKDADIYLLQEVDNKMNTLLGSSTLLTRASATKAEILAVGKFKNGYTFVWDGNSDKGDLAIVYKKKIGTSSLSHDNMRSKPNDKNGGQYFQSLDIEIKPQHKPKEQVYKFKVINCHLDSKPEKREACSETLLKGWLNDANVPNFILGGDFNCELAEAQTAFFNKVGIVLGTPPSSSAPNPPQSYSPSSLNNFTSDHLAVYGKIRETNQNTNQRSTSKQKHFINIGLPYATTPGNYNSSRKMRDLTSEQPNKIGEIIEGTIDHIFYYGSFISKGHNLKITTFNVLAVGKWDDGFVLGP